MLCSLLRRNTTVEYLLRYTIGLGLIKGIDTLKEGRDVLLRMMSTLKASCLLLDHNNNDQFFDVYDLTYIVAKSMASKDKQVFALKGDDFLTDWPNEESMKKCNKICLQYPTLNRLPDQLNCPQLSLFLLFSKDLSLTFSDDFFKKTTNLKLNSLEMLSLLESDIRFLPKEIGQLVKLKLLDGFYSMGTKQCHSCGLHALSRLSTLEVQIPDDKAAPHDFFQELQKLERYKIFIGNEWKWERFRSYRYSRTLKLKLNTGMHDLDLGIKKLLKKTEDLHLDELKGVKIALRELIDEESISQLKNLHIQNGLDTEYIINDECEFPQLQSLTLHDLPKLISFCPQHETGATSSLPQHELPLFNEKISFLYLENLWLKSINVTRVWHNQLSMHLTDFEITGCYCLREIIFMEEIEEETQAAITLSLFPQLMSLKLKDLQHLTIKFKLLNFQP
ncbi:hypothetical protein F3Y22_tig00111772pilonHSYRG00259 [Hibiscus syriacus]|uniref:Uncharacterized protein n=1 Tax=Hibiscus syriacus TaxID=106335 RepID=A0A6A2XV47_HIBSY|nr:hypothetical protein F3Y22_tig00111772pilonHSYRG00259 [Hibiscus syriacus]